MAGEVLSLSHSLGTLFGTGVVGDVSDGQLLERFTAGDDADEPAFDALVERHGPMVLRVCRRLLDDPNDAEDAFQATFLVLLRQARSIRHTGSLAAWLHGVAQRVAARARVESARRRRIERHAIKQAAERNDDPDRLDLEALIDVELARLPRKYREPIVLCYLEELTHEGAADRLGWPVGTVRGRLARARDLLRSRLIRRGITASAALAAVGLVEQLGSRRRPDPASRGHCPVGRSGRSRPCDRDGSLRTGRSMGHGRFPQSRFLPLDNGCGRAVPARDGRYGPGASDARRSAIAAAADPSRSPHAARTARRGPSRDAPAQGHLDQHADGRDPRSMACPRSQSNSRWSGRSIGI